MSGQTANRRGDWHPRVQSWLKTGVTTIQPDDAEFIAFLRTACSAGWVAGYGRTTRSLRTR
jgi:hypothetical protein